MLRGIQMKHNGVFVFAAVATTAIGSTIAFAESGRVVRRKDGR